jgi:hypothetical protein
MNLANGRLGSPGSAANCEAPVPRIQAIRVVDLNASNSWAEFAGLFRDTHQAHTNHERAKGELKALMPDDAKEAMGLLANVCSPQKRTLIDIDMEKQENLRWLLVGRVWTLPRPDEKRA